MHCLHLWWSCFEMSVGNDQEGCRFGQTVSWTRFHTSQGSILRRSKSLATLRHLFNSDCRHSDPLGHSLGISTVSDTLYQLWSFAYDYKSINQWKDSYIFTGSSKSKLWAPFYAYERSIRRRKSFNFYTKCLHLLSLTATSVWMIERLRISWSDMVFVRETAGNPSLL